MPREMTTTPVEESKEGCGVHVTMTLATPAWRRKAGKPQEAGGKAPPSTSPRIPRITRLMALAIKFQGMLDCGAVRDYADLARLGYVTRARVTQIMNLLLPQICTDMQKKGAASLFIRTAPRTFELRAPVVSRQENQPIEKRPNVPAS